jgi:hypothetical protein
MSTAGGGARGLGAPDEGAAPDHGGDGAEPREPQGSASPTGPGASGPAHEGEPGAEGREPGADGRCSNATGRCPGLAEGRCLVIGVGARAGVSAAEVGALVAGALRAAGRRARAVLELATLDARAAEPGLRQAAAELGVPLVAYPAEALSRIPVPNPSDRTRAAVGTPSVAEAAALARGGALLVAKRPSTHHPPRATCAIACRPGGPERQTGGHGAKPRDTASARSGAPHPCDPAPQEDP